MINLNHIYPNEKINLLMEGHPGVPPYEEYEALAGGRQNIDRPAATVYKKDVEDVAVKDVIVERIPTADSIRAPGPSNSRPATRPVSRPVIPGNPSMMTKAAGQLCKESRDIDAENEAVIAAMTDEEILKEQDQLYRTLPPKLYQQWSHPRPPS
jgi:hypothetical protein